MDEEAEAKEQLKRLEAEEKAIQAEKQQVRAVLHHFAEERRRKAEESERQRRAEEAERARKEAEAGRRRLVEEAERARKEAEALAELLAAAKETNRDGDGRGRRLLFSLFERDHVDSCFSGTVTSMACGGKATIMLYEDGGHAWTSGLPKNLYNKLNGRQRSLPSPEYVAMGNMDRYYIRFADGKSEWVGCEGMSDELKTTTRRVKSVAFGERWDSYFIVYTDGWWSYSGIPDELSQLMKTRNKRSDLECVSLGPDGEYFVSAKNGRAWWGGTSCDNIDAIAKIRDRVKFIDFGDDNTFLCRYT